MTITRGGTLGQIVQVTLGEQGAGLPSPGSPMDLGRPAPHDLGGALCAYGVFAAGIVAITFLGACESGRRSAPE